MSKLSRLVTTAPAPDAEPDIVGTDARTGNRYILSDPRSSYFVEAIDDVTGRRYRFWADLEGASGVFREELDSQCGQWRQIRATRAISRLARKVVREAISKSHEVAPSAVRT
jgi:hypothetical protein